MKKMMMIGSLILAACGGVEELEVGESSQGVAGGTVYSPSGAWEAIGVLGTFSGYNCTATLISEYAVLTAAHCVTNGASVTFTLPNGRGSVTGTAVVHPRFEFNNLWLGYDYAIIRLSRSIYEEPNVDMTGLAPMQVMENDLGTGSYGYLYGYGGFGTDCSNGGDGQARYRLIQVTNFNQDWNYEYVSAAGSLCGGDSGGPFVVEENSTWKVAGVNSWKDLSIDTSAMKPTYMVFDWIKESSGAPNNPGNTWGQCVYYDTDVSGGYLSVQSLHYPTMPSGWNNAVSSVWVKKGYRVRIYDEANYVNLLATIDGFNGDNCNEHGCFYDLGSLGNRASSARCENAIPTSTWGNCVYYDRFGGSYLSVQGDYSSFTGNNAAFDNRISQVWVKAGYEATIYPRANYQAATNSSGNTYWSSVTLRNGTWCNSYGCLYDLTGTILENTASSITCH